jgi:hypothetical protein
MDLINHRHEQSALMKKPRSNLINRIWHAKSEQFSRFPWPNGVAAERAAANFEYLAN